MDLVFPSTYFENKEKSKESRKYNDEKIIENTYNQFNVF